jgi:carbon-monoxide dehydrogenase medium subunit
VKTRFLSEVALATGLKSTSDAVRLVGVVSWVVKPPPFEYSAPETLEEALDLLAELGDDARPLAGGQSLIPLLSLRLARPSHLIDLAGIADLRSIRTDDGHLVVAAMVRESSAERHDEVRRYAPLLAEALPLIGHPAIRSRGTIGGSLAHADPAAELPAVAVAVDAELIAESQERGRRSIAATDFFTGFFTTALEPDEILTSIRIPAPAEGTGSAVEEVSRRHGDFAMVGAAAVVRLADGKIVTARVVLTGVSGTPHRASEAENLLVGAAPSPEAFAEAAAQAAESLTPPADVHGSSNYRRRLAAVLVRRTLEVAVQRAREAA